MSCAFTAVRLFLLVTIKEDIQRLPSKEITLKPMLSFQKRMFLTFLGSVARIASELWAARHNLFTLGACPMFNENMVAIPWVQAVWFFQAPPLRIWNRYIWAWAQEFVFFITFASDCNHQESFRNNDVMIPAWA